MKASDVLKLKVGDVVVLTEDGKQVHGQVIAADGPKRAMQWEDGKPGDLYPDPTDLLLGLISVV